MDEPLRAYIVADIEGTTGVWSKEDTLLASSGWKKARIDMTEDISVSVDALFNSGAESVVVKDFHRDGFNLIPRILSKKAHLVRGYYLKPVIMYGNLFWIELQK